MRFKSMIKKVVLPLIAAFSIAGSIFPSATVLAEGETVYPDYDESRTGSITLYKYVSNDGKTVVADGTSFSQNSDENLQGVQDATGNYRMLPEKGVEFAYFKIADFIQVNTSSTSHWYVTNLNSNYRSLLADYGINLPSVSAGRYTVDTMTDGLSKMCEATNSTRTGETALRELVSTRGTAFPSATNAYGKTKAENLPVGLYLVAEVNWEHQAISKYDTYWNRIDGDYDGTADGGEGSIRADIVSPSSPFFVQLPMASPDGKGWNYTVSAYPKNSTITVHKDIVTDDYINNGKKAQTDTEADETSCDYAQHNYLNSTGRTDFTEGDDEMTALDGEYKNGLTHQMDVMIGETVTQLISCDLPKLSENKKITVYNVSDRMTKGLNFSTIRSVRYGSDVWNADTLMTLKDTEDYMVSVNTAKDQFTVSLTSAGLAKINATSSAGYFYVLFDSVLTKDAMIGTDTYEYITENNKTIAATNQNTAKLTFATDRTSQHDYYSNTTRIYTYQVSLTKTIGTADGNEYRDVEFKVERRLPDGSYESIPMSYIKADTDGTAIYMPDALGKLTVNPGRNGKLNLSGLDSGDFRIVEVKTARGLNLLKEPVSFSLSANRVTEGDDEKYEDGTLLHAYVWSGNEPANLKAYDLASTTQGYLLSQGIASFNIQNNSIIQMLRTGGTGTMLIVGCGAVIMLSGMVLLYLVRNRKDREE